MSQSLAWDALCGPYRDAVEAGRDEAAAAVLREVVDIDVAYVRRSRCRAPRRIPRSPEHRAYAVAELKVIDWLAWLNPSGMGLVDMSTFDSILREHYTTERVAGLASGLAMRQTALQEMARNISRTGSTRPDSLFVNPRTYEALRAQTRPVVDDRVEALRYAYGSLVAPSHGTGIDVVERP